MKPRAFVVMPFEKKTLTLCDMPGAAAGEGGRHSSSLTVDFEIVWNDLIKPALEMAHCEPFRANSEISAGDIRTDMFFELVTADYVVADLSIPNANVYYELGIRDGVCSRGAFIIDGGWPVARPFDVAQDRSFQYDGKLFEVPQQSPVPAHTSHAAPQAASRVSSTTHHAAATKRAPVAEATESEPDPKA